MTEELKVVNMFVGLLLGGVAGFACGFFISMVVSSHVDTYGEIKLERKIWRLLYAVGLFAATLLFYMVSKALWVNIAIVSIFFAAVVVGYWYRFHSMQPRLPQ